MFEDTKGVFRSRKSKKTWQCSDQKKKEQRTNNYPQSTTQKPNDQVTWTNHTEANSGAPKGQCI